MLLFAVLSLLACRSGSESSDVPSSSTSTVDDSVVVFVPPAEHPALFDDFVAFTGHPDLRVGTRDDDGVVVSFQLDLNCVAGCYRVEDLGAELVVHGSDVTALQYGAADIAEAAGIRYFHPQRTHVPDALALDRSGFGVDHTPAIARRGLHMHTLHPIEGFYDFWEPGSASGEDRAKRTIDWVVKNRGNHIQWVALDDITGGDPAWEAYTTELVDYAHARGMTTGLGVQLFGGANLQSAFDLEDTSTFDPEGARGRIETLLAPGVDLLNLSFGEFSGEEPDVFVAAGTAAVELMREVEPSVDVTTVIHVGNYDDLRVEYEGEELLYYFLGTKLGATPWIHTVMYYNLFEDAGLAYLHEEFDEHRDYLLTALENDDPVGYFPESSYWVAFDINVPTYLPIYIRSRFVDMDEVRSRVGEGALQDHVLFSSGWEWGYWQNDVATLRMTYETPADYRDEVRTWFTPWGSDGDLLGQAVIDAADVQHAALIGDRLAAYLGGREIVIDIGEDLDNIVSQPDRPQFDEIVAMSPAELDDMQASIDGLFTLSDDLFAIHATLVDIPDDPFVDEIRQGLEVTALRARFAAEVHGSAVAFARGEDPEPLHIAAMATLEDARTPVDARHGDMHWAGGDRIIQSEDKNDCLYQWGYLAKGEELCFWDRELVQLENELGGTPQTVPGCF